MGVELAGGLEAGGDVRVREGFGEGVAVGVGVDEESDIVPVDAVCMEVLSLCDGCLNGIVFFAQGLDVDVPFDFVVI